MIIVFVPLAFYFVAIISKSKLIYDPNLIKRKYLIISLRIGTRNTFTATPREGVKEGQQCEEIKPANR